MDRRREDVRDSFLDMVDAENENAIQTLETPLEVSIPVPKSLGYVEHVQPGRVGEEGGEAAETILPPLPYPTASFSEHGTTFRLIKDAK